MTNQSKLTTELAEIEAAIESERAQQARILASLRTRRENIQRAIRAGLAPLKKDRDT